jgi:hypothetical protein
MLKVLRCAMHQQQHCKHSPVNLLILPPSHPCRRREELDSIRRWNEQQLRLKREGKEVQHREEVALVEAWGRRLEALRREEAAEAADLRARNKQVCRRSASLACCRLCGCAALEALQGHRTCAAHASMQQLMLVADMGCNGRAD